MITINMFVPPIQYYLGPHQTSCQQITNNMLSFWGCTVDGKKLSLHCGGLDFLQLGLKALDLRYRELNRYCQYKPK